MALAINPVPSRFACRISLPQRRRRGTWWERRVRKKEAEYKRLCRVPGTRAPKSYVSIVFPGMKLSSATSAADVFACVRERDFWFHFEMESGKITSSGRVFFERTSRWMKGSGIVAPCDILKRKIIYFSIANVMRCVVLAGLRVFGQRTILRSSDDDAKYTLLPEPKTKWSPVTSRP